MLEFSPLLPYPAKNRKTTYGKHPIIFIRSANIDDTLHMPGVILGAWDWVVQKTEKVLALLEPEI